MAHLLVLFLICKLPLEKNISFETPFPKHFLSIASHYYELSCTVEPYPIFSPPQLDNLEHLHFFLSLLICRANWCFLDLWWKWDGSFLSTSFWGQLGRFGRRPLPETCRALTRIRELLWWCIGRDSNREWVAGRMLIPKWGRRYLGRKLNGHIWLGG